MDFLVLPRVVVEIDGEGPVRASSDQVVRERRRDRYLVAQGYAVLRFAGDEVFTNPWRCAEEVRDYLLGRRVAGLEGAWMAAEAGDVPTKPTEPSGPWTASGACSF